MKLRKIQIVQELEKEELPKYVKDYITRSEDMLKAYMTKNDQCIFTNKKIIIFATSSLTNTKMVQIIPYNTISNILICFNTDNAKIKITLHTRNFTLFKFKNLSSEDKVELRMLYNEINELMLK